MTDVDDGFNEHLDTLEGLERRRRFTGAADNERRDEIREGLASCTGVAA
jgi:hypothetical protein